MTEDRARDEVIKHWLRLSHESLESMRAELAAGRFVFAVNRAYYACFYAASAVLLREGKRFAKHAGVRAALHLHLVKSGLLDPKWGMIFDQLFQRRQEGDYRELLTIEAEEASKTAQQAEQFVAELGRLL